MEKSTTEQLRSEIDKLNNTIADLKNTFDISPGLICVANAKTGQYSECNPAVKRILGFTVEEFTSRPFNDFIHPDDQQKTVDVITEQLKGAPVANFENRYRCKDGSYKWLAWQATAVDKNGKVYAVATDITKSKQAEEELKENEEKYRSLFDNMHEGFALHKIVLNENNVPIDYIFVEANDAFENLTGLERKKIIGKKVTEILPGIENDPADWIGVYGKVALTEKEIKFEQYSKPLKKWYSVSVYSNRKYFFATLFFDITERKKAEEKLKAKNKFLDETFNSLSHPFYVIDIEDYTIVGANKAAKNNRYTKGITCYELTHSSDRPCHGNGHDCPIEIIKKTKKDTILEHIHYRRDDKELFVEVHSHPIFDKVGNIKQIIEYTIDITDRKHAEKALQASEKQNRSITQTATDAIISIDSDGIILSWNSAAEKIFGYSLSEMLNKNLSKILPAQYKVGHKNGMNRLKSGGKEKLIGKIIEITAVRKNGNEFPIELSLSSWETDNKKYFTGIIRDITKRKFAENVLRQSKERYRSLSKELIESNSMKELLLDIIAHGLRNPAGAIKGFAEFGLENDPNNEILAEINQSTVNLLQVIDDATILSKVTIGDTIEKKKLNIGNVIKIIIKEYSSQLQYEKMILDLKLKGDLIVYANPIIGEVFRNYISNAIKYAKTGKKIVIDAIMKDGYATVNVKDFGKTIAKKDRENIFKRNVQLGKTKGRGLGLAIVERIAEAHDAEVGVKPNKPTGNIFYIKIPI